MPVSAPGAPIPFEGGEGSVDGDTYQNESRDRLQMAQHAGVQRAVAVFAVLLAERACRCDCIRSLQIFDASLYETVRFAVMCFIMHSDNWRRLTVCCDNALAANAVLPANTSPPMTADI